MTWADLKILSVLTMHKAARHSIAIFATMLLDQWLIWYQLDCGASCSATLIRSKIRLERCNQALQMCNEIMMRPVDKCSQSIRIPWNKRYHHFKFKIVVLKEFCTLVAIHLYKLWFQLQSSIQSSIWKKQYSCCVSSLAFKLNIILLKMTTWC